MYLINQIFALCLGKSEHVVRGILVATIVDGRKEKCVAG